MSLSDLHGIENPEAAAEAAPGTGGSPVDRIELPLDARKGRPIRRSAAGEKGEARRGLQMRGRYGAGP